MKICHIALGGCLTAPHVNYGVTEDTGGHIAYVLGAARAQAARPETTSVEIVTRAFDAPHLGAVHAQEVQDVGPKLTIRRIWSPNRGYLTKEALSAEIPALVTAFLADLRSRADRPDIIHAHFADAAELALAARKTFGIPVVYTPHSLALSKTGAEACTIRITRETEALKRSDATIVSSRDESDVQVDAYGAGLQARVHRVAPGVTVTRRPDRAAAGAMLRGLNDPDRPMILAVARPVARKNLVGLARIYAASKALQARANLVILAGQHQTAARGNAELQGQLDCLKTIARMPQTAGRMALPPSHRPQDVLALYDAAARGGGIFANLAVHEPFGLTLLEAAAHGLPVVATRDGGPCDIVSDLSCGLCVDPADHAASEAAMMFLLTDRTRWSAASDHGRTGVARYDWATWADKVNDIYAAVQRPMRGGAYHNTRPLLVSDIDNTLTGDRAACGRFANWTATAQGTFAVATGRSVCEARRVLAKWALPEPYALVTSVGTEIYLRNHNGRFVLDRDFAKRLEAGWDRAGVMAALKRAGFVFQAQVEQRRWKLSGFGTAQEAARIEAYLARRSLPVRVVASHGRLIDVLPRAGGKARAVAALARRLGVAGRNVIVAGDSGNDADMLEAARPDGFSGIGHGIVVANALPEVLSGLPHHVYRSPLAHADGVLDGLARLGHAQPVKGQRAALEAAE